MRLRFTGQFTWSMHREPVGTSNRCAGLGSGERRGNRGRYRIGDGCAHRIRVTRIADGRADLGFGALGTLCADGPADQFAGRRCPRWPCGRSNAERARRAGGAGRAGGPPPGIRTWCGDCGLGRRVASPRGRGSIGTGCCGLRAAEAWATETSGGVLWGLRQFRWCHGVGWWGWMMGMAARWRRQRRRCMRGRTASRSERFSAASSVLGAPSAGWGTGRAGRVEPRDCGGHRRLRPRGCVSAPGRLRRCPRGWGPRARRRPARGSAPSGGRAARAARRSRPAGDAAMMSVATPRQPIVPQGRRVRPRCPAGGPCHARRQPSEARPLLRRPHCWGTSTAEKKKG